MEAEILILRHQVNIQRRDRPNRLAIAAKDRLIFVGLYRLVRDTINALTIVKPDTVFRWHRAGFRSSANAICATFCCAQEPGELVRVPEPDRPRRRPWGA
ncbi:MAG TPA: hypothetical protein VGJ20_20105 [Xanthobacteraceae bacterium]